MAFINLLSIIKEQIPMILLQKFRRFFLTMSLVLLLGSFTANDSLATTFLTQPISLAQTQLASMNRVEAIGKDIQGKAQETIGKITGNKEDQVKGKIKQVESKVRNAVEDIKETSWRPESRAVTKNIEAKTEKAIDNSIVNPNYLPQGKTDDIKSESRNPANKMKDEIRATFK